MAPNRRRRWRNSKGRKRQAGAIHEASPGGFHAEGAPRAHDQPSFNKLQIALGVVLWCACMWLLMRTPAHCADSWTSISIGRSGACSWHGGVDRPDFLLSAVLSGWVSFWGSLILIGCCQLAINAGKLWLGGDLKRGKDVSPVSMPIASIPDRASAPQICPLPCPHCGSKMFAAARDPKSQYRCSSNRCIGTRVRMAVSSPAN